MRMRYRQQIVGLKIERAKWANKSHQLGPGPKESNYKGGGIGLKRVFREEESRLEKDQEYFDNKVLPLKMAKTYARLHHSFAETKKMVIDSKVSLTAYERFVKRRRRGFEKPPPKRARSIPKKHVRATEWKKLSRTSTKSKVPILSCSFCSHRACFCCCG